MGVRALWRPVNAEKRDSYVVPQLRLSYLRDLSRGDSAIPALLPAAGTGAFTIPGVSPSRDQVLAGTSIAFVSRKGLTLFADYDALVGNGQTTHAVGGGIRFLF